MTFYEYVLFILSTIISAWLFQRFAKEFKKDIPSLIYWHGFIVGLTNFILMIVRLSILTIQYM